MSFLTRVSADCSTWPYANPSFGRVARGLGGMASLCSYRPALSHSFILADLTRCDVMRCEQMSRQWCGSHFSHCMHALQVTMHCTHPCERLLHESTQCTVCPRPTRAPSSTLLFLLCVMHLVFTGTSAATTVNTNKTVHQPEKKVFTSAHLTTPHVHAHF